MKAEGEVRSLTRSIEKQTEELKHRKSCLHHCESLCNHQPNIRMCEHASIQCKESSKECTQQFCDSCLDVIGRDNLCHWEDCTTLSQNNCLRNSCKAFMNTCQYCPAPFVDRATAPTK